MSKGARSGRSCVCHRHPSISVPPPRPLTLKKAQLIRKGSELHNHGVLNRVPFRRPHGYLQELAEPPTKPLPVMCGLRRLLPNVPLFRSLRAYVRCIHGVVDLLSSPLRVSECNHDWVRTDRDDPALVRFRTEVQGR